MSPYFSSQNLYSKPKGLAKKNQIYLSICFQPNRTRQDQIGSQQLQIALNGSKWLHMVVINDPNGDRPGSSWSCYQNTLKLPFFYNLQKILHVRYTDPLNVCRYTSIVIAWGAWGGGGWPMRGLETDHVI